MEENVCVINLSPVPSLQLYVRWSLYIWIRNSGMSVHTEPWNCNVSSMIIWLFQTYTHGLELWKTLMIITACPTWWRAGLWPEGVCGRYLCYWWGGNKCYFWINTDVHVLQFETQLTVLVNKFLLSQTCSSICCCPGHSLISSKMPFS